MHAWDGLIRADELNVYKRAGYGRLPREGRRPAVLVVDMEYNFTGDRPEPILASIAKFRNSCGEAAWRSIPKIARLLRVARGRRVPVIYTRGFPKTSDVTRHEARIGTEIVLPLIPRRGEAVYRKAAASAFFGTPLAGHLVGLGVDTVLVTGCTTSGCVRATAVDSVQNGFRPMVIREAVGDRSQAAHDQTLFDLNAKYADVVSLAETLQYLNALRAAAAPGRAGD